jgi:hypothetical protein
MRCSSLNCQRYCEGYGYKCVISSKTPCRRKRQCDENNSNEESLEAETSFEFWLICQSVAEDENKFRYGCRQLPCVDWRVQRGGIRWGRGGVSRQVGLRWTQGRSPVAGGLAGEAWRVARDSGLAGGARRVLLAATAAGTWKRSSARAAG